MDLTGSERCRNPGKNAAFRCLVEVCGSRWMMKWWPGRKLTPRHADFQSAALPTELPGPTGSRIRHRPSRIVNYSLKINDLRASVSDSESACRKDWLFLCLYARVSITNRQFEFRALARLGKSCPLYLRLPIQRPSFRPLPPNSPRRPGR